MVGRLVEYIKRLGLVMVKSKEEGKTTAISVVKRLELRQDRGVGAGSLLWKMATS